MHTIERDRRDAQLVNVFFFPLSRFLFVVPNIIIRNSFVKFAEQFTQIVFCFALYSLFVSNELLRHIFECAIDIFIKISLMPVICAHLSIVRSRLLFVYAHRHSIQQ